jgi:hypothetical protein
MHLHGRTLSFMPQLAEVQSPGGYIARYEHVASGRNLWAVKCIGTLSKAQQKQTNTHVLTVVYSATTSQDRQPSTSLSASV